MSPISSTFSGINRRRVLAGGSALITLAGIGMIARSGGSSSIGLAAGTPSDGNDTLRVSTSGWLTDFSKHSVSLGEFSPGGPPRDGIPPIDAPVYTSIADADTWLGAEEPVIAVAGDGTARAYPLQILIWHEIVNDEIAGKPVLVTFCPLCNTAIAFDRQIDPGGPVYDFGTTGNLRLSDLVMWDRQTESWWQQLTGEAIVGELTGKVLTPYPAQIIGWSAFKLAYPAGDVLSRETGFSRPYGRNPYVGYDNVGSSPFLYDGPVDGRLRPMDRVIGLTINGDSAAYLLSEPLEARTLADSIGGSDFVILVSPGSRSALDQSEIAESRDVGQVGVFVPRIEDRPLTFTVSGEDQFVDNETGSIWDVTGQAVEGQLIGQQLVPISHVVVFWFAWAASYPDSKLGEL